ncbi:MAG: LysM peptidoglycan-binding domain-containing protein [Endomicrobiales bacterium]
MPSAPEPGQKGSVRPERIYKVWLWQETKDCLWNLAERYYGDPWQWKKIYLANKAQIADPRVIYPRQELIIPYPDEPER